MIMVNAVEITLTKVMLVVKTLLTAGRFSRNNM